MPFDFYRREQPAKFEARVSEPTSGQNYYGLQSEIIFEAKNRVGKKEFSVTIGRQSNKQTHKLVATVTGNTVVVKGAEHGSKFNLKLTELRFREVLKELDRDARSGSIEYQVAKKLCEDHAKSSRSSPLISGTIVNNFGSSSTYSGYKMRLRLKLREPFENPFVSGLEKEYFLIGDVKSSDCEMVYFLGKNNEVKNEIVNPPGSRIPRPPAGYKGNIEPAGSQKSNIPHPSHRK